MESSKITAKFIVLLLFFLLLFLNVVINLILFYFIFLIIFYPLSFESVTGDERNIIKVVQKCLNKAVAP